MSSSRRRTSPSAPPPSTSRLAAAAASARRARDREDLALTLPASRRARRPGRRVPGSATYAARRHRQERSRPARGRPPRSATRGFPLDACATSPMRRAETRETRGRRTRGSLGLSATPSNPSIPGRSASRRAPIRTYPQVAQSAVEMLIIQRSQIAAFSVSRPLAPCLDRPYIPSCAERGAGVGRSSTGRSYGAARKGRNGKSTGVVDETATGSANFFGPKRPLRRHGFRLI